MRHILRYTAYPLLLLGNGLFALYALTSLVELGPANLLAMFGTILFLAVMERVIPYRASWHATAREWARDGLYFTSILVVGGGVQAMTSLITLRLAAAESSLPLLPETLLCLGVSTFFGYWYHRATHVHGWLWKIHGIHHVPKKVNLANNSVVHFLDSLGSNLATSVPLVLLGFSQKAVFLVTMFMIIQGYTAHCNADLRLGWINYLIYGPEPHRLHHSVHLEEAGHYSTDISLWDHLFGSFTWRPGGAPATVGVVRPEEFPEPNAMLLNALHPFRHRQKPPRVTVSDART